MKTMVYIAQVDEARMASLIHTVGFAFTMAEAVSKLERHKDRMTGHDLKHADRFFVEGWSVETGINNEGLTAEQVYNAAFDYDDDQTNNRDADEYYEL